MHHNTAVSIKKQYGETYSTIFRYFYPEFIASLILYSGLNFLDSYFIAQLHVTATYTTLGVTNTLFHFITKVAEGFSVGMVVLCGQYNGAQKYTQVGRAVTDAFWATCITGGVIASILYCGAHSIYAFYGIPQEMVELGVPFLRLRALGVFFHFVYLGLTGFLRGIKNTKAPMYLALIGSVVFIFFDYALIFGKCGFKALGFQGSALACVLQYNVMFIAALIYILYNKAYTKYGIYLLRSIQWSTVKDLVQLSWPVMIDKASLALSQMWLVKMMACIAKTGDAQTGKVLLSSFVAIKDIERLSILPALALAQVITFLVSNDYRLGHWKSIKNNIKKTLLLSCVMVFGLLFLLCCYSDKITGLINTNPEFTSFVSRALPIISILVFFDLLQLVLSAALRGAADVKTVMFVRLIVCGCFFVPLSYALTYVPLAHSFVHFILMYSSLYIGNALMSLLYIKRFRSKDWKKQFIKECS
jgi:putative MATE family efflux protein